MINWSKILLLGMALAIPSIALAQPEIDWMRTYGDAYAQFDMGVIRTQDHGYAFCCTGFEIEEHGTDFQLVKLDSLLNIEWRQYYHSGRNDNPVADFGRNVRQLPDGGYILIGDSSADGMLVRTDENGEEIWRRFCNRNDGLRVRHDCVVDIDGNIVVIGGNMVAKFSDEREGEEIWRQTYDVASEIISIVALEDGGFVLAAHTGSLGAQGEDLYAARIDSDGDILWQNAYGTEHTDYSHSVIQTSDGGFCLAGVTRYGGMNYDHPIFVRLDTDGNEVWQRYDENGTRGAKLRDIVETPDGGFVGVGYNESRVNEYVLVRVDYFGEVLWRAEWRDLRHQDDGVGYAGQIFSVMAMENGGYMIGGNNQVGIRNEENEVINGVILLCTTPDPVDIPFELEPETDEVNFGEVDVDSSVFDEIAIVNTGRCYVVIDSLSFVGDSVFTCPMELPFRIDPPDTAYMPIEFQPLADSLYSATLNLWYADESLEFDLTGIGKPYNGIPETDDIPTEFALTGVYPNPFNSTTTIGYSLPATGAVSLAVYDLSGREVARLADGVKPAGTYEAVWVADGMSSGVYVVKLVAGNFEEVQKMVLVK